MTSPTATPVVLLVDDDASTRSAIHAALDCEYTVVDADDGPAALEALGQRHVDLVIMGLLLPGIDGLEVLQRIGQVSPRTATLVVSAIDTAATAATAIRLGAYDYLTKPFEVPELLAQVHAALRERTGPGDGEREGRGQRCLDILLVDVDVGLAGTLAQALIGVGRVRRATGTGRVLEDIHRSAPDLVVAQLRGGPHPDDLIERIVALARGAPILAIAEGPEALPPTRARSEVITLGPTEGPGELLDRMRRSLPGAMHAELPRFSRHVCSALHHVSRHYADMSVTSLGLAVGVSPYYLSSLFRAEVGRSLKRFQNEVRVKVSEYLLLGGTEKIESIAARVGFHDASHLSRIFMKYVGSRPGQVRERARPLETAGA